MRVHSDALLDLEMVGIDNCLRQSLRKGMDYYRELYRVAEAPKATVWSTSTKFSSLIKII